MSKFNRISVDEAEWLLLQHENLLLLDMRDMNAYCRHHHPRALHLNDMNMRSLLKHSPKNIHVVIYCYHGNSSQDMARLFADFGFENCYSVDGGFDAWRLALVQSVTLPGELLQRWIAARDLPSSPKPVRAEARA
ncbi:MAG: thiosulfate sulfurtransferase GlpE [Pseudomonadota bacterium]